MRLINSVQKAAIEADLIKMRSLIDTTIHDAGFDPADYPDLQLLIDTIDPSEEGLRSILAQLHQDCVLYKNKESTLARL